MLSTETSTVPPLTFTASDAPPTTAEMARDTASVLDAPPARFSVDPSLGKRVPAPRVPLPLELAMVLPVV